jgi:hypothetical protein
VTTTVVPITIMAQELGTHLRRCMAQEDVAKQFTEQELKDAKQKWSCNSFQELQEEAEVWGWDDMVSNKWAR